MNQEKHERITEVPTLCPVLDILSYGGLKTMDWGGADDGHGPGHHQQPPGAVHRGPVADREHYCTQPGVSINSSSNDPFYSHYIIHVIEQCPGFCKRKYVSSWIPF